MVEQDPVKIKVRGSNPRGGAIRLISFAHGFSHTISNVLSKSEEGMLSKQGQVLF